MEERTIYPLPSDGTEPLLEVARSMRDSRPAHYTFKIESFSLLLKFLSIHGEKKYESRDFEVGGYKWRLSLYPNGDAKRNGADHISLYLVLSEKNNLPFNLEVNTYFKLFAYDQIRDKYLTVQDVSKKGHRFHGLKNECGFSQFIPLITFNDKANGYLVDDCCIFGAEVIVTNCTGIGEIVSTKKPKCNMFTCKWEKFSKLEKQSYQSSAYLIAGWNWCVIMYPNRDSAEKGLGLYLELAVGSNLLPGQKVYVNYKLVVKNQLGVYQDYEKKSFHAFDIPGSTRGWAEFLSKNNVRDKTRGYIVNDTLLVEAEITSTLVAQDLS